MDRQYHTPTAAVAATTRAPLVHPSALLTCSYCACLTSHSTGIHTAETMYLSFSEQAYLPSCGTLGHLLGQEHSVLTVQINIVFFSIGRLPP